MKVNLTTGVKPRRARHIVAMVLTIAAGSAATIPLSPGRALAIPRGAACQTDVMISQHAQDILGDQYQDNFGDIVDDTLMGTANTNSTPDKPGTPSSYQAPLGSGGQPSTGSAPHSGFGC
jgi:hypothetical protein